MRNALILTVVFFLLLVFNACEKNNEMIEQKGMDPTEQKILNFKEKMKTHSKSDELMSIDSAVWYIEAALNYTYCVVSEDLVGDGFNFYSTSDSLIYNIDINDNEISIEEATSQYNTIVNEMGSLLVALNCDLKFFNTIDVEIVNNSLIVNFFIRYADMENKTNKYLYNITDGWYPGMDNGNCSHTIFGKDLTDEIEKWLSINRAVAANTYYTDIIGEGYLYSYNNQVIDLWEPGVNKYNIYPSSQIQLYMSGPYTSTETYTWIELFALDCVEPTRGNICAVQTNLALEWAISHIIDNNRHLTSWNVLESKAVRHFTVGGVFWHDYYPMHRVYVNSGIPHSTGGGSQ